MRIVAMTLLLGMVAASATRAQSSSAASAGAAASKAPNSAPVIQTEKVQVPEALQTPPASMSSQPGYLRPEQARHLLVKIWQAESRVRDLMSQAHPELLRMPPQEAVELGRELEALGENLSTLETARAEFAGRVDSEFLGFQTYAAITNLLPPLNEAGDTVYRYQSQQLGGMFRQAWNDMFSLEGALQTYIAFLTRNHDQIYALMQGNLYHCENQLNAAMRAHPTPTKMIRNIVPFKPRKVLKQPAEKKSSQEP